MFLNYMSHPNFREYVTMGCFALISNERNMTNFYKVCKILSFCGVSSLNLIQIYFIIACKISVTLTVILVAFPYGTHGCPLLDWWDSYVYYGTLCL